MIGTKILKLIWRAKKFLKRSLNYKEATKNSVLTLWVLFLFFLRFSFFPSYWNLQKGIAYENTFLIFLFICAINVFLINNSWQEAYKNVDTHDLYQITKLQSLIISFFADRTVLIQN